jgi:hypothetical protein
MEYLDQLEDYIWCNAKSMANENDRAMDEYEDRYPNHFEAERRITALVEFIKELSAEGHTPLGSISLTALEVVDRLHSPVGRYVL